MVTTYPFTPNIDLNTFTNMVVDSSDGASDITNQKTSARISRIVPPIIIYPFLELNLILQHLCGSSSYVLFVFQLSEKERVLFTILISHNAFSCITSKTWRIIFFSATIGRHLVALKCFGLKKNCPSKNKRDKNEPMIRLLGTSTDIL